MSADPKAVLKAASKFDGGLRACAEAIQAYQEAVQEERRAERKAEAEAETSNLIQGPWGPHQAIGHE